jgi:hypothetical protein
MKKAIQSLGKRSLINRKSPTPQVITWRPTLKSTMPKFHVGRGFTNIDRRLAGDTVDHEVAAKGQLGGELAGLRLVIQLEAKARLGPSSARLW